MRNSIQGPLLRTGNNSSFKALGETGYPVFKMAFQLREAIYRLDAGRDLARHLAIPQNEQGGDRTDWYSSFAGDVIPWSGATESERASARQQFTEFQMSVQALSEKMLNTESSNAGGDRQVFAQLLTSAVSFPDNEFLYLVNGTLVITFWGFVHPTGEQRNPMHWLQPGSVPASVHTQVAPVTHPVTQPLAQPLSTPTHTIETVTHTQRRRWSWRWLLWLLVALLSLALILGLLRGCVPSLSLPGLPKLSGDGHHSLTVNDAGNSPAVAVNPSAATAVNTPVKTGEVDPANRAPAAGSAETPPALDSTGSQIEEGPAATDTAGANAQPEAPVNPALPATEPAADTVPATVPEAPNSEPQNPAVAAPPVKAVQGDPLTLPAALPDGPAQFLNGQWRVNGGIQDKFTGKPLQLQYNFDQGKGTVSVRQSNGVVCTGAAAGSVQKGALSITNPEQMKCSDDSNFIGPTIACKSPASGHTDCVGSNDGDKTFPIRMLQPHS